MVRVSRINRIGLLLVVALAQACSESELKVDGKPWYAVVKASIWQQTVKGADKEKQAYQLMFDNYRYFIIKGQSEIYDFGRVELAPEGARFILHNSNGAGYIAFKRINKTGFNASGEFKTQFDTIPFSGKFEISSHKLRPPASEHIYAAAKYGDLAAVEEFLKKGGSVEGDASAPRSPLAVAATYNQSRVVKLLLAKGANAKQLSRSGWPPLALAIQSGDVESAQALIAAGADINFKSNEGVSLLFKAFERDSLDMVKLLVKSGADIKGVDNFGFTAIHRSMSVFLLHKSKIIERMHYTRYIIEEAGYNPQTKDKHGRTALFYAANLGLKNTVNYLIEKGLDPNAKDSSGQTVFDYIAESDYRDIVMPLLGTPKATPVANKTQ